MLNKLRSFLKKAYKRTTYPIIYSYPSFLIYDSISRISAYKKERRRIQEIIGYYPDLKNPKSFNEKILWKKIYDRNPLLPIIADKYKVRQYLKEVLGEKESEKILVPLLYVTDKPQNIPFDSLSGEYVIKPTHASGKIILAENIEGQKIYMIIKGKKPKIISGYKDPREEIIAICKNWLLKPYQFHQYEWAYQKTRRKILIEKLLLDSSRKFPIDYKFEVFYGKCELILVYYDRFVDINGAWYTPEWEYVNVRGLTKQAGYSKKPTNLKYMIDLAEFLGKPFDFIRVDLCLVDSQIYFGELTNYPLGGTFQFNPLSYDFELGSKWKVVPGYWKHR